MTLQDWLDAPWCHDPLHINRFHRGKGNQVGIDRRDRLPLHEPRTPRRVRTAAPVVQPVPTKETQHA